MNDYIIKTLFFIIWCLTSKVIQGQIRPFMFIYLIQIILAYSHYSLSLPFYLFSLSRSSSLFLFFSVPSRFDPVNSNYLRLQTCDMLGNFSLKCVLIEFAILKLSLIFHSRNHLNQRLKLGFRLQNNLLN